VNLLGIWNQTHGKKRRRIVRDLIQSKDNYALSEHLKQTTHKK
jgi:hypothetical protein